MEAPGSGEKTGSDLVLSVQPFSSGQRDALERHVPSWAHPYRIEAHESGYATFLLAWENETPVGYLLIKWNGSDARVVQRHMGRCPELDGITVAEGQRSRGIGTTLIQEAERLVANAGFEAVALAVGIDNPRAQALYERLGYVDWGHGTFEASWEAPNAPGGREYETCVELVKRPLGR
jgi:ribosomal protein S18 acetylase RimI-like enzyme